MLLTESLMLAFVGGLGGIAVAYAGIRFLHSLSVPSELPVLLPFRLDERVLLASLALSLVSAVACGLAPALQATRTDLVIGLKAADADAPGRRRLWGRNALVVAQVSLSLVRKTTEASSGKGASASSWTTRTASSAEPPRAIQPSPGLTSSRKPA